MADNRQQRRAAAALNRRAVSRQSVTRSNIRENVVPEGKLVLMEKDLIHPDYGPIHIVVDETIQENLNMAQTALRAMRRIPMNLGNPQSIPTTDRAVQWYVQRDFPLEHAKELAAHQYILEEQDIMNSASFLALFAYIDFDGPIPEDPLWDVDNANRENYDLPPRPVVLLNSVVERKLRFIKDLIYTGGVKSEDEEGNVVPSFQAQLMALVASVGEAAQRLVAEGVVGTEEDPIDEDGFQGVGTDRDVPPADDADGEATE